MVVLGDSGLTAQQIVRKESPDSDFVLEENGGPTLPADSHSAPRMKGAIYSKSRDLSKDFLKLPMKIQPKRQAIARVRHI